MTAFRALYQWMPADTMAVSVPYWLGGGSRLHRLFWAGWRHLRQTQPVLQAGWGRVIG